MRSSYSQRTSSVIHRAFLCLLKPITSLAVYRAINNVECIIQAGFSYCVAKHLKTVLELGLIELFDFQYYAVFQCSTCPLYNHILNLPITRFWSLNTFGTIALGKLHALVVQLLHL